MRLPEIDLEIMERQIYNERERESREGNSKSK